MTGLADAFAQAAEDLVGTPFKLHGRDPAIGIDCVGLVACALERCSLPAHAPGHYTLRQQDVSALLRYAKQSGFVAKRAAIARGDLLLVKPGPAQHHLLVATSKETFVHAHAGLRRVVIQPGPLATPILACWYLAPHS